jgi:predicted NBD/HSP70 family sugar kinase
MLRRHGDLRRSQLARLSGLPRSTIADVVARLQQHGIVVERPIPAEARTRTGRPPRLLALAAPSGLVGVIALTHGTLQAAVMGFDGTVHARRVTDSYVHDLKDGVVEPGLALLGQALDEASCGQDALACAVLGLPMPIVPGRGRPRLVAPPLPRAAAGAERPRLRPPMMPVWVHTDPSIELGQRLGVPAWAENDANLGALGEGSFGAAAGMPTFIYIKMVQGIGAGLVVEGRLHRGAKGLAGELAHLHVQDGGFVCGCGGRGCLVTILNTPQLIDFIHAVHPAAATMADVLSLAASGDTGVWRLLRDLGGAIGRSLADFCVYLAPDGIVLDGILQNASTPVIDGIKEKLHQFAPSEIASRVRVAVGMLGDRAELLGAAALARHKLFGQETLPGDVAS